MSCYSSVKHHLAQWQSVLTIGMRNLIAVTLHEFHQCINISSYKCLCMIFIIQSEFINLGNSAKLNFWTPLSLLQCIYHKAMVLHFSSCGLTVFWLFPYQHMVTPVRNHIATLFTLCISISLYIYNILLSMSCILI